MGEVYLIDKMGYCIKENVIYYMVGSGYSMMTEWEDIYNFLNDVEQGIDWEY